MTSSYISVDDLVVPLYTLNGKLFLAADGCVLMTNWTPEEARIGTVVVCLPNIRTVINPQLPIVWEKVDEQADVYRLSDVSGLQVCGLYKADLREMRLLSVALG